MLGYIFAHGYIVIYHGYMAMAQNYQPQKWMVFLPNMIRNLLVIGTIILSQTLSEKVQKTLQTIVNHTSVPLPKKVRLDPKG